jgi:hypothetical protein
MNKRTPSPIKARRRGTLRRVLGRRLTNRFRSGVKSRKSNQATLSTYGAIDEDSQDGRRRSSRGWGDEGEDEEDHDSLASLAFSRDRRGDSSTSWFFWQSNRPELQIVVTVESYLRWIFLLLASFLLGIRFAGYQSLVARILEYTAVAWVTSISLGCLLSKATSSRGLSQTGNSFDEEEGRLLLGEEEEEEDDEEIAVARTLDLSRNSTVTASLKNTHPALDPYSIVDCNKVQRLYPNSMVYKLDTDYFSGEMMVLIRTPDVDDITLETPAANVSAVDHMRGKQRRFEFQFQLRLKKVPTGTVYFSCELTQAVKLGMVQRAFVAAAMAFVKSTNSSFHYSIGGSTPNEDGSFEKPHMSFPVQDGMNRVVATPPGQRPPTLGTTIEEDPESLKRRKKGFKIEWNLEDTYTFALWSAYVDFLDWKCINLPGIRPFGLTSVIGKQPIYLTLYEIDDDRDKHYRKDMTMIAEFEMSNSDHMGDAGPVAYQWRQSQRQGKKVPSRQMISTGSSITEPASPRRLRSTELDGALSDEENSIVALSDEEDEVDGQTLHNQLDTAEESLAEQAEAEAAAELGEGIYVQSGDCITLRESVEDELTPSYLTMGGGFAILQEQTSSIVMIEKAGRSRRGKSGRSKLIKSGDTVLVKLVTKGRKGGDETRYLSLHRGWWLKWIATTPSSNGYFTIFTHETEFDGQNATVNSSETQASYLTLGGAFWLRHRRWSKFSVGAAAEGSTTYGGRMLGVYTQRKGAKSNLPEQAFISDDPGDVLTEHPEGKPSGWLKPLQFRAFVPASVGLPVLPSSLQLSQAPSEEQVLSSKSLEEKAIRFSEDDYRLDAPVWIELMNRTHRVPQLAYVVRIQSQDNNGQREEEGESDSFVRIRTGRDLAEIMRVGLSWRTREVSVGRRRNSSAGSEAKSPRRRTNSANFSNPDAIKAAMELPETPTYKSPDLGITETDNGFEAQEEGSIDGVMVRPESLDEASIPDVAEQDSNEVVEDTGRPTSPVKKRKFIGKLAHSVKSKTASTGKAVVRGSVKVGKGTMSAGRAIIPIRSMNPPAKEPNQKNQGRSKRETERDLHVAVSRSMKRMDRIDSRSSLLDIPVVLAGELAAPEQSARTVSNMLAKMSSLPRSSEVWSTFNELLASNIEYHSSQDEWFLQGGAVELGVASNEDDDGRLYGSVVARCLWESHWREEWCVVSAEGVGFFAPNSTTPGLELLFDDVRCIRSLESGFSSPLPGYPVLVLETAWMCHYIAFANEDKRDTFCQVANRAKEYEDKKQSYNNPALEKELRTARYWQGFKSSIESSLGKGKWAEVSSNGKSKPRVGLNNRRMVFDLTPEKGEFNELVEEMLTQALSFSLDSLVEHPEALIRFLDLTSYLQVLRLEELDFSSPSCFCLFVNIYHCLLQHALLLTVNGPLHKRSCAHFMRTSCYDIGGDVFSLAELQCCVIRGNMSKTSSAKSPYVEIPKKSSAFRYYALGYTTPRVHFVLNTGDLTCPNDVMVLQAEDLEEQLNIASFDFVRKNVKVDATKRVILVPKVCDVYRSDFAVDGPGAAASCLRYCLGFLEDDTANQIHQMMRDSSVTVKFRPTSELYHTFLEMKTF